MTKKWLSAGFRSDPVYYSGIIASGMSLIASGILALAGPIILDKFIFSTVVPFYSPDGVLDEGTFSLLKSLVSKIPALLLGLSCLVFCYTFIWRYFSSRLSTKPLKISEASALTVSLREALLTSAVILLALLLRLHGMTRDLTFDELWTALLFVDTDSIWRTITSNNCFNNHIAYSILARISQFLFGRQEWALRLPALLLGLGAVWCLWILNRRFLGPKIAIASALALALHPAHVAYSQTARGYAGMILFTLVSTHLYFKLLDHPARDLAVTFILSSVIAIYFHLHSVPVTMVHALFLLYLASKEVFARNSRLFVHKDSFRMLWLSFLAIVAISAVLHAPMIPKMILDVTGKGGEQFQPLFPIKLFQFLSGDLRITLQFLVGALLVVGLISLRNSRFEKSTFLILLFILPVSIVWFSRPGWLYPRFFFYLLPFYLLVSATGFFTLWDYTTRACTKRIGHWFKGLGLILVLPILYSWTVHAWTNLEEAGFRRAVRAMEAGANETVALCAIGGGSANFYQYYTKQPILVPDTKEAFQQILEQYSEVRCAYRELEGQPDWQTEIADFLSREAKSQRFADVTVFTYSPMKHPETANQTPATTPAVRP